MTTQQPARQRHRFPGMTADERAELIIELTRDCPALIFDDSCNEDGDGHLALAIKHGPDDDNWELYWDAPSCRKSDGDWFILIKEAMDYAKSLKEPPSPEMSHCHPNHYNYAESRKTNGST